jgi:hypothetical protein
MKYRRHIGAAIVLIAVTAVGGLIIQEPLMAQVRAALVRDADNPDLAPFRGGANFALTTLNTQQLLTTVPAGKRLVIDYISYWTFGPNGDELVFAALRAGQFGPLQVLLEINPPHASASSGLNIQDGTQAVRAYFEAGEEVWVSASHNTGVTRQFEVRVHGHYVTP